MSRLEVAIAAVKVLEAFRNASTLCASSGFGTRPERSGQPQPSTESTPYVKSGTRPAATKPLNKTKGTKMGGRNHSSQAANCAVPCSGEVVGSLCQLATDIDSLSDARPAAQECLHMLRVRLAKGLGLGSY